jgi:uncharacterized protein (DUF2235 family)
LPFDEYRKIAGPYATEQAWDQFRKLILSGSAPKVRARNNEIHFLGLFDCVPGNQIYLRKKVLAKFNDPTLERSICHFAHAVSRDERRWSFRPLIFSRNGQETFDQMWFPGFHYDLGGGSNPPLNNLVLQWMMEKAIQNGLRFLHPNCGPLNPNKAGHEIAYPWTKAGLLVCDRASLPNAGLIDQFRA